MGVGPLNGRIDVLDHGYAELLDVMADDREPARAARVSYSDGLQRSFTQDMTLTRYLLDHGHLSPFEMVEVKFAIKAPIFVARQLVRHRTANWNEFSMRYAEPTRISDGEKADYYTPAEWRGPTLTNKQGSDALGGDEQPRLMREYEEAMGVALDVYANLKLYGAANEMARMVLPVSVYTTWVWKCDLRNVWNLLEQRDHDGAQWETREYAKAMIELLKIELPCLMEIWEERRHA